MLPTFLDFIVWGHEHEAKPHEEEGGQEDKTTIYQPGQHFGFEMMNFVLKMMDFFISNDLFTTNTQDRQSLRHYVKAKRRPRQSASSRFGNENHEFNAENHGFHDEKNVLPGVIRYVLEF